MPEVRSSPTVRRRELGRVLRALRNEKGLTVEEVAELLLCSPSKVSRMETGHGIATLRDVRDLCNLYGVTDEAERDRLRQLASEGKQQGWWQPYDLEFSEYVGLETAAVELRYYQSTIVPGLLQTADYARAMIEVSIPKQTPARIEELLEVKVTRQRILQREPPLRLWAVLDEAALHRIVGGPTVMAAQLDWLIEAARSPNVTIQVVAYEAGAHPAMDSTFNILHFADPIPSVVYVEGLVGWIYLDRPADIGRYQEVFAYLCALALSPDESVALISRLAGEYKRSEPLAGQHP